MGKISYLEPSNEDDFNLISLIGIVTNLKAFQLIWSLNKTLGINFVTNPIDEKKLKELSINLFLKQKDRKKEENSFILYQYHPNDFDSFYIIKNHRLNQSQNTSAPIYIAKEYKEFDYILEIKSEKKKSITNEFINKMNNIKHILLTQTLDLSKIKNKNNLLF